MSAPDLLLLRAAIVFAQGDAERAGAQREFDLARELLAKTQPRPRHRAEDREGLKGRARAFVEMIRDNWDRINWDRKDTRIGALAKQAVGDQNNASHAFTALLRGLELLIEDRHIDADPFDEFHILAAVDLIRRNRRSNKRTR